jgi:hypothetical protein
MALTWREERPDAITAASHRAERPSRSMVTIFSALSSSSEVRIRFSRSLCAAGFLVCLRACGAAAAGVLRAGFFAGFLRLVLAGGLVGFFAGIFFTVFAAFAFAAGFLAALRVRAEVL